MSCDAAGVLGGGGRGGEEEEKGGEHPGRIRWAHLSGGEGGGGTGGPLWFFALLGRPRWEESVERMGKVVPEPVVFSRERRYGEGVLDSIGGEQKRETATLTKYPGKRRSPLQSRAHAGSALL